VNSASPIRERALDAACDITINDGVAAVTHQAIAARIAEDRAAIEDLYPTLDALLGDMLNREVTGLRRQIAADIERDPRGGLLSRVFHYALTALYERPLSRALYLMDPDGLAAIMRATHGTAYVPRLDADLAFFTDLQHRGMIRSDVEIGELTAAVSAFITGTALRPLRDIDATIGGLIGLLERGADAPVTDTEPGKRAYFALLERDTPGQ
jgi:AcrR family transcriptional regulator